MCRRIAIIAIMVLASACSLVSGEITVSSPWTRPGLEGENSAVYFEIAGGRSPDILLSAMSEIASEVMIHKSIMDEEGTMRMEHQENVPIPAGETVKFEPGGLHIMLIGLHQDLVMGEAVELKLLFENTGEVIIPRSRRKLATSWVEHPNNAAASMGYIPSTFARTRSVISFISCCISSVTSIAISSPFPPLMPVAVAFVVAFAKTVGLPNVVVSAAPSEIA